MIRRALAVVALGALAAVLLATRSEESPPYRVAAIFDTAKGMVPGQQVKIAGAAVGSVREVELTRTSKARIVMDVDARFRPFGAGASCRILPEGLISENYVECDPGSAPRALAGASESTPTVPLEQTAVPVDVQDVINVFSMPTGERLRVLIHELGLATAGRGEDLNAILRRANPALAQSRRLLSIVDDQRRELANAVGQTDRVLSALADDDRDVRAFVDRAAVVARTSAGRRDALGEAVHRLPPMLDAVRPGLRSLDRAMASASPLLDDLRGSAPALRSVTRTLPAFSRAGVPALRGLASAAARGRTAVRAARPVVSQLERAAIRARPFARNLDRLLVSVRDKGAIEGTLNLLYALATDSAAYDEISHILSIYVGVYPQCFQDPPPPQCVHAYTGPQQGTAPVNAPGGAGPADPGNARAGETPSLEARAHGGADGPGDRERLDPVPPSPQRRHGEVRPPGGIGDDTPAPIEGLRPLLDYLLK